ncbi:MAG: glycosyltransferase family 4 protein [Terriglobales bacterium]
MSAACAPRIAPAPASRLLFVTATAANVRQGSGTYVGIAALRHALRAQGLQVGLIAPPRMAAGAWRRLWFNYRVRGRLMRASADFCALVGFDLDGVFFGGGAWRHIAAIKGVVAEELQFESGLERASLRLLAELEGRRARRADRVIATSEYAAAAIRRHYRVAAERIRVVPELLDLGAWQGLLDAAPCEPRLRPRLLCVAHLYPRKDVATLLRALARMRIPAEAHIVGTGPERKRLCRLAAELGLEDRVQFLGHIRRAELAREYRNADLFCHPSRQEGFGIVLLEAMAAGLPVVAARAAAIPEVVPDGECGRLFDPGSPAGLAGTLEDLLADAAERARLGAAGRRHATRYDAERVAREFLAALA